MSPVAFAKLIGSNLECLTLFSVRKLSVNRVRTKVEKEHVSCPFGDGSCRLMRTTSIKID